MIILILKLFIWCWRGREGFTIWWTCLNSYWMSLNGKYIKYIRFFILFEFMIIMLFAWVFILSITFELIRSSWFPRFMKFGAINMIFNLFKLIIKSKTTLVWKIIINFFELKMTFIIKIRINLFFLSQILSIYYRKICILKFISFFINLYIWFCYRSTLMFNDSWFVWMF